MNDLWDAVDRAIRAEDSARVTELLSAANEKQRIALWPQVDPFGEARLGRLHENQSLVRAIAAAWTAPGAKVYDERSWVMSVWNQESEVEVADALEARAPLWLPKLDLLGHGFDWRLHRELYRRGLIPRGDPAKYLGGMVSYIMLLGRRIKLRDALLQDLGLLETEVYELFASDEIGTILALQDQYAEDQSGRDREDLKGREHSWSWVLVGFAEEGRLDRARLLELAHNALVRDTTWPKRRWFATFIDRLDPSIGELARHQRTYLRLLSATASPAVSIGQRVVKQLLESERLDVKDFLADAYGPLMRKEKAIAMAQLGLLAPMLAMDEQREEAALVVAEALGHVRPDVQAKALTLLERVADRLSDSTREAVATMFESSSPSVRARGAGRFADITATPTTTSAPSGWTAPSPADPPPTLTDDELSRALVGLMGRSPTPAMMIEAVLDGLLRRAGLSPDEFEAQFSPAVTQARRTIRSYQPVGHAIAAIVLAFVNEALDVTEVYGNSLGLSLRFAEVRTRIATRRPTLLLSFPTDGAGRVDPSVLRRRLDEAGTTAAAASIDRRAAEVRAGLLAPRFDEPSPFAWDDPRRYIGVPSAASAEWRRPTHPAQPAHLWWSLYPHDVERAVGNEFESLACDLEHEPTADSPSGLAPLCRWLVDLDTPLPPAAAAAVGLGLSAKVATNRLAAVDALLAFLHAGHLAVPTVAGAVAAQVQVGLAKINRLAGSLEEVREVRPAWALELAMTVASDNIAHREAGKLLDVAVEAATEIGLTSLPGAVRDLAAKRGSSMASAAAARLVDIAGG